MTPLTAPALAVALTFGGAAMAQQTGPQPAEPLSARASDPGVLGWMQGQPPAPDKTIRPGDPDFFAFPKLRWTVCHFSRMMPVVAVDRGPDAAAPLPEALDPAIGAVAFTPLGGGGGRMTWDEASDANYSDGVIVLHHGRVVYERHGGCLEPDGLHGAMSVTKSLTGLMAEALIAEGRLDEAAPVAGIIPELAGSAFGDATVRQVLEMTTALDYSEDYADPGAGVWTYSAAGSAFPKGPDDTGPRGYYEALQGIGKGGTHGEAFGYKTPNADVAGWLVARVTGRSVADHLAQTIWSRLGQRREGYYTVDALGTPFAGGGFNASLRDMARLGQMILDGGRAGDRQIIPEAAIARLRQGGDRARFAKAGHDLPGWSYQGLWWITHDDHGSFTARGVHGQTIWIDPRADMVIARFASHPVAANAASDPTSLPAFRAVADYLIAHDDQPLLGAEWVAEDIGGQGVIDNSHASLQFLRDGRLAGNGTCNRILGRYQAEGGRLALTPAGTTMMACPEALMAQERRFLDALGRVDGYRIDGTGALVLTAAGNPAITARR
ncbi:serine hydrolase [Paracoccus shandongensis]|uniref:serine hydrolase n=1 Tax=Paracoccus shandongensis TaxID=2816048 RepID=UPI001A8E573B|nr:serine hydrolase [Paracoccus shandongensis]